MPAWTDRPDPSESAYAFRIVRTPPGKPIDAICTSTELVGCPTHFVSNRTVPCERDNECPLCEAGHSWRWHGYTGAILTQTHEHVLFECTAAAADTFRNFLTLYETLRGCHFYASRPSGRPNGRVVIKARPEDLLKIRLPDPPAVKKILCHIWGIQYTEGGNGTPDSHPHRPIRIGPGGSDGRYRA